MLPDLLRFLASLNAAIVAVDFTTDVENCLVRKCQPFKKLSALRLYGSRVQTATFGGHGFRGM